MQTTDTKKYLIVMSRFQSKRKLLNRSCSVCAVDTLSMSFHRFLFCNVDIEVVFTEKKTAQTNETKQTT